jgi:hypothetical protein
VSGKAALGMGGSSAADSVGGEAGVGAGGGAEKEKALERAD